MKKLSNDIQRQVFRAETRIEHEFNSLKPARVAALQNALGALDSAEKIDLARKVFDRPKFGKAKLTGMGVKADKRIKARYGKPETYISGYIDQTPIPIIREIVDQAGRVMLPSERGTIKRNRATPRSSASKRGGVGAKNKIRAEKMSEEFLRDAANQAREASACKARAILAHFATVDIDALPRKQRHSARRAVRKALANL